MNWISSLFGKKRRIESSSNQKEQHIRALQALELFEKGKDLYFQHQPEEALENFDLAFENGFVENFSMNSSELFDMRGSCLQMLNYDYDAIEDFDKAIELSPTDCNKYFSRSISKKAVLDFKGAIADLETAIELSSIDNELNREYNDEAQKQGYSKVADVFEQRIFLVNIDLDEQRNYEAEIQKAENLESKVFWQKIMNEQRERRLSKVKKRL